MKKQNKKINIYFILAGENLFHPNYLFGILERLDKTGYKVVGITVSKDHYPKGMLDFVQKMFGLWGIGGFFVIAIMSITRTFIDRLTKKGFSLATIAERFKIPYIESNDVNSRTHLNYLSQKDIDIIVSSNGQIFKKELLSIPKIACINRHSGLLPNYAGVLPVFWAMFNNEKKFGVTIHHMVEKIDEGGIVLQKSLPFIKSNSLFANYIIAFNESIDLTVQSLGEVQRKKRSSMKKISYYSFPTESQLSKFRKEKKPFLLKDVALYLQKM